MTRAPTPFPGRVVVGFDGSDHAVRALDRAADEAARRGTSLEIVCGWPWGKHPLPDFGVTDDTGKLLYSSARRLMDAATERVRARAAQVAVSESLTTESAARALLRCGRDAALTVVGTRGHGGFAGLLLGSVSLRVAAHCTTPLMVVRGDGAERHHRVLVGVESEADDDALHFAFQEARRCAAELRVLHAWQYPAAPHGSHAASYHLTWDELEQLRKGAEAVAQYAVAPLREIYPDVAVHTDTVCQQPGKALVEAGRNADVTVLAAHRRPRRVGLQLGPVTHAMLHHAHCPVVLVPVD
ncbi:universal stress protein [Streptomyces albofaciens JCM 4342]|uniref:universal stress protein n=1 Tax=Streptomyces albofaciens TaxID=66866 RepID=UPI00123AFEF7|nr:universal stress protein [Streptomyces albofaciens]KAA6212289.1 universal stress protein [Streptomyces albofaciens JCM 4342]